MRIYIDEREHLLYEKLTDIFASVVSPQPPIQIIKKVLVLGDIVLEHADGSTAMLIERKSIPDLLASIRDSRYEEQSYRLIHSSGVPRHNIMYLIEGIMNQVTNPKDRVLVYSSITSLNHYKGFSVYRTASVQETAEWIWQTTLKIHRNWLKKVPACFSNRFVSEPIPIPVENSLLNLVIENDVPASSLEDENSVRNIAENVMEASTLQPPPSYSTVVKKVKKENITPENWSEIALCQIPGISSISAAAIIEKFGNLQNLIKSLQENPQCLTGIRTKSSAGERKLSSAVITSICQYLSSP